MRNRQSTCDIYRGTKLQPGTKQSVSLLNLCIAKDACNKHARGGVQTAESTSSAPLFLQYCTVGVTGRLGSAESNKSYKRESCDRHSYKVGVHGLGRDIQYSIITVITITSAAADDNDCNDCDKSILIDILT